VVLGRAALHAALVFSALYFPLTWRSELVSMYGSEQTRAVLWPKLGIGREGCARLCKNLWTYRRIAPFPIAVWSKCYIEAMSIASRGPTRIEAGANEAPYVRRGWRRE
jgi:hypothetical protein